MVRNILFQVHLWTGLVLGLILAALGISGSVLVYDHDLMAIGAKPIPRAEAQGTPLPLDRLIAAAQAAVPDKHAQVTLTLPDGPGEAAMARLQKSAGAGREGGRRDDPSVRGGERKGHKPHKDREGKADAGMRGANAAGPGPGGPATDVYLDPVSGKVLDVRKAAASPVIRFFHDLHGNLLLGRDGRQAVGWFGVAMMVLGCSGIVLWWPKRGAWKYAFGVRKRAKGYLFHRDLHGATGIWLWIVFIVVSFSGVVIVFPDTTRAAIGAPAAIANFDPRRGPQVEPLDDVSPIGADAAVALVRAAAPGKSVSGIALPVRKSDTIRVMLGSMDDGPVSTAYVDPYRKTIAGWRNSPDAPGAEKFIAWQRPLHAGGGAGPIWRALVFISGFLPLLFVTTGTVMWLKKRKGRTAS